jgi:hypothetical protein
MGVAGACAGIFLFLLPDLLLGIPREFQVVALHPLFWITLAIPPACLGAERLAGLAPSRWAARAAAQARARLGPSPVAAAVGSWAGRFAAVDHRGDPAAARLLGPPLTAALGLVCAVLLLTWAPHYLTWPLWADNEQFAISAQAWDAGIRPYRDLADFDFPGPIYVQYLLGKVFGWGHTTAFYAADLMLLLLLGGALLAWSRRLFGTGIPGLIGFLAWLAYYLGRDFTQVAQRDWQGPALVALGLLALESLPGRLARPVSAMVLAAALAYRPQPILFIPAFLSAVDESARRPGEPPVRALWAAAWWSVALVASLVAVFIPLIAAGVLDDFVGALRVTRFGGNYNRTNWSIIFSRFRDLFWGDWTIQWLAGALALLAVSGPAALRRPARTWMLALAGAVGYKAISPVQHEYLDQPMRLAASIGLTLPAAWLLAVPRLTPSGRLAGLVVLLASAVPGWPRYCTARGSLDALGPLVRGEIPEGAPPGCRNYFPRGRAGDPWDDYRRVLLYLRHEVDRRRPVASLLRSLPLPAVNAPSGHLSPFPSAAGCMYLLLVDPGLEDGFIEALERTAGTLVVWRPHNPDLMEALKYPRMEAAVRRHYRPCERFGYIQVWERSDGTGIGSRAQPGGVRAGRGSAGRRSDPPDLLAPGPPRRPPQAAIPPRVGRATGPRATDPFLSTAGGARHERDAQAERQPGPPQQPALLLEDALQERVGPRRRELDIGPVHVARAEQSLRQDDGGGQGEQQRVEITGPDDPVARRREDPTRRGSGVAPVVVGDVVLATPEELVGRHGPDEEAPRAQRAPQGAEEVGVILGVLQDVAGQHAVGRRRGERLRPEVDGREAPAPARPHHVPADIGPDDPVTGLAKSGRRRARAAPVVDDVGARRDEPTDDVADDRAPGPVPPVALVQVRHEAVGVIAHRRRPLSPHPRPGGPGRARRPAATAPLPS